MFVMVEVMDATTATCVVVRFGGKVSGEEYKVFLDAIDERLEAEGEVNMVAVLNDFVFYGDLEALKEDTHFGIHEYRKVGRAAYVGDKKWIGLFVKISEPFYKAEAKHFAADALDEAISWACSSG